MIGSFVSVPVFLALGGTSGGRMDGPGAAAAAVAYVVLLGTLLVWLQLRAPGMVARSIGWPVRGERIREATSGVGWGLASQVAVLVIAALVASVLASISGRDVEAPQQIQSGLTGWAAVVLVVYAVILAPIDGGVRLPRSDLPLGRGSSWVLAGSDRVRGSLRLDPLSSPAPVLDVSVLVVTMMVTGTFWAWIHWRHRNLLVNIATHAAFNAVGVVLILRLVGV